MITNSGIVLAPAKIAARQSLGKRKANVAPKSQQAERRGPNAVHADGVALCEYPNQLLKEQKLLRRWH
jgi:hypothetical protein